VRRFRTRQGHAFGEGQANDAKIIHPPGQRHDLSSHGVPLTGSDIPVAILLFAPFSRAPGRVTRMPPNTRARLPHHDRWLSRSLLETRPKNACDACNALPGPRTRFSALCAAAISTATRLALPRPCAGRPSHPSRLVSPGHSSEPRPPIVQRAQRNELG
jgi:hypothetical protein